MVVGIDNRLKLVSFLHGIDLRQVAEKTIAGDTYCLWKTGDSVTWLVSLGSEEKQHVFLTTVSMTAAEVVYRYASDRGMTHVKGGLI